MSSNIVNSTIFHVDGLCCGGEATLIRETLEPLEGVVSVKVSVVDRRAKVEHTRAVDVETILKLLNDEYMGARIEQNGDVVSDSEGQRSHLCGLSYASFARICLPILQTSLFTVACIMCWLGYMHTAFICSIVCIVLSGSLLYKAALSILRRLPNAELLMAIAVVGSLCLGNWLEAASVGTIVAVLDAIVLYTHERVDRRLNNSIVVKPPTVDVPEGGSQLVSQLVPGSVYVARAGDALPTDGEVKQGSANVDESSITGEAMPQPKAVGDTVLSGSVLTSGFLQVVATKPANESFVSRIEDAVLDAKNTRSQTDELVSRFVVWYMPTVILIATIVALVTKDPHKFLVILVAGCPCSLVAAAPFVQSAALTLLAKNGLLLKHSSALEDLARLGLFAFDKTGTLTMGQFTLVDMQLVDAATTDANAAGAAPGLAGANADGAGITSTQKWEKADVHRWLAAVEARDSHPLARSLVMSYTGCLTAFMGVVDGGLPEVQNFERHGRDGVSGSVCEHVVGVGNAKFVAQLTGTEVPPEIVLRGEGAKGTTCLYVTVDGSLAATLLLSDEARPDAPRVLRTLRDMGIRPVMLTGDKHSTAVEVAKHVGIDEVDVFSGLLPETKASLLCRLSEFSSANHDAALYSHEDMAANENAPLLPVRNNSTLDGSICTPDGAKHKPHSRLTVGFVGDGLNDCPALATANVGIVMQEVGARATTDAAMGVIQDSSLDTIPYAIITARRTQRLVLMNIILSLAINLVVIGCAAFMRLPLWVSVMADSVGLLAVMLNGLWPLCWNDVSKTVERKQPGMV
ncbi:hypothetical protein SARC_04181 [Sphaeroforma arctica JP610]|uniref:HMA domain-containing protein n=1 Tax=Sphaeroforma arctica JP610 TaxID=667725 RepID=A0A0L0G446_9EUKA|nr:hypothetical protein SARC_04181 [Sphaeroforma arctica JP610]KNC83576.1 hypothetical protein SARC_04181 [Sphaeroforma arctica JP610]|eukprot:XP_014157478.1 hypothetical protein SARC_04181 [Sphaeroforma arctica JP610]